MEISNTGVARIGVWGGVLASDVHDGVLFYKRIWEAFTQYQPEIEDRKNTIPLSSLRWRLINGTIANTTLTKGKRSLKSFSIEAFIRWLQLSYTWGSCLQRWHTPILCAIINSTREENSSIAFVRIAMLVRIIILYIHSFSSYKTLFFHGWTAWKKAPQVRTKPGDPLTSSSTASFKRCHFRILSTDSKS